MAMTLTSTAADAMLTALGTQCNSGRINIYMGTPPANASAATTGATLLATATFGNPAFSTTISTSGNNRVMAAEAITADTAADASGPASFFRALRSDGTTVLYQGSVGTSASDMIMPSTDIIVGGNVSVSSLSISLPMV